MYVTPIDHSMENHAINLCVVKAFGEKTLKDINYFAITPTSYLSFYLFLCPKIFKVKDTKKRNKDNIK